MASQELGPGRGLLVAVLPLHNLSGASAPLKEMRLSLMEKIQRRGVALLEDRELEDFMARHRVRYIGGINNAVAKTLKAETGVDAILVTSLELYDDTFPPKIALFARLVSTGDSPRILWIDSVGLAGDDSPGLLDLGLVEDPLILQEEAISGLSASLLSHLARADGTGRSAGRSGKFRPKTFYGSLEAVPGRTYRVAVTPFFNRTGRRNAGEIMTLLFVEQLFKTGGVEVIEPGIVRETMLNMRLVLSEGVSFSDADAFFSVIETDLVLSGKVFDYHDYRGPTGSAKVNFSTLVLENKKRAVVWSSNSYNESDDSVFFFDFGRVNTAHVMASSMTRLVVDFMVKQ